jgi:calcineurin-like phosphoesterase family protein
MLVHDRQTLDGAQVLESSDPQIRVSFLAYPRVLCGHVHNMWKRNGNCFNVGVDVWDFRPVTMSQIMEAEHG